MRWKISHHGHGRLRRHRASIAGRHLQGHADADIGLKPPRPGRDHHRQYHSEKGRRDITDGMQQIGRLKHAADRRSQRLPDIQNPHLAAGWTPQVHWERDFLDIARLQEPNPLLYPLHPAYLRSFAGVSIRRRQCLTAMHPHRDSSLALPI